MVVRKKIASFVLEEMRSAGGRSFPVPPYAASPVVSLWLEPIFVTFCVASCRQTFAFRGEFSLQQKGRGVGGGLVVGGFIEGGRMILQE